MGYRICFAVGLILALSPQAVLAFGTPLSMDSLEQRRGEKITVPLLARIMAVPDHPDRFAAVSAAGELDEDAKPLVPHLIKALSDGNRGIRCNAAHALGNIGPSAADAVPELIKTLNDDHEFVRNNSIHALGNMGPMASAAVPALMTIVRGDSPCDYPFIAADALGKIGTDAQQGIPVLVSALRRTQNPIELRRAAAGALGKIAVGNEHTVLAALANAARLAPENEQFGTEDADPYEESLLRIAAALSLWKVNHDPHVIPWLISTAQRERNDALVRERAVEALAVIGPDAGAATNLLTSFAAEFGHKKPFQAYRWKAFRALGTIGRKAESAIPILVGQINLEYGEGASVIATDALGRIGPSAHTAATVLFQALTLPWEVHELECRPRLRLAAAVAIRRIGADTGPTVPVLISLLSIDETPVFHSRFVGRRLAADIRRDSAGALGELGGAARDAIPALTRLQQDDFITVREAAELAIHRINANGDDR